jgi:hypothetical protein
MSDSVHGKRWGLMYIGYMGASMYLCADATWVENGDITPQHRIKHWYTREAAEQAAKGYMVPRAHAVEWDVDAGDLATLY